MTGLLLSLLLAPLLGGVVNRVKAFFAGRQGPPLLQPYRELARLARKGMVLSRTTTAVFLLGPALGLAALVAALALVPLGGAALAAFPGDLVALLGLLALVRFGTVVAALDTGSSFEGMGASREVTFGALAEPGMFLALAVAVCQTGALSLSELWRARELSLWASSGTGMALLVAALFCLLLAENSRIPVDDPTTHLELTMVHEVMVLDHSGPALAAVLYGASLKLWLGAALLVSLVLPVHTGQPLLDLAAALGGVLGVGAAIGVVESTAARLPMARVGAFLAASSVLSTLAILLAVR